MTVQYSAGLETWVGPSRYFFRRGPAIGYLFAATNRVDLSVVGASSP